MYITRKRELLPNDKWLERQSTWTTSATCEESATTAATQTKPTAETDSAASAYTA